MVFFCYTILVFMDLLTSVSQLNRVGKILEKKLDILGIKKIQDLLYYFPFRYDDFRKVVLIKDVKAGEAITIKGRINLIANRRSFKTKKIITEALVEDSSGTIRIIWFNQPFLTRVLKIGDDVSISGKVSSDMLGAQFVSPVFEKISGKEATHTSRLVPIYPLTHGLTNKQIRFLIDQSISLAKNISDWLPEDILEAEDFVPLADAIKGIHFPVDEDNLSICLRRLKFDELLKLQLRSAWERKFRLKEKSRAITFKQKDIKEFVSLLPFNLTKSQKVAAWEILGDLGKSFPMNRLLSGDVGSGKTIVAAIAALNVISNGLQVVFMAPTEILATQHFETFSKIFSNYPINIGLLTRSQANSNIKSKERSSFARNKKMIVEGVDSGNISVLIGTHSVLNEKINFKNLGLVIIDEQHRFGVEQRKRLKEKKSGNTNPHFLSMTATPIPRSLALTLYGDLDLSVINELPVGRKLIITRVASSDNRNKAYDFVRKQINNGRQAFVVCPLIEGSETSGDKKSVLVEYEKLSREIFPDLKVGYLHGKMKGPEKEKIMQQFKQGDIDILISTSVIEVGVDIPNASVMIIEGAERFGLAQLHQFRGRVGRSIYQSYCVVFSDNENTDVVERLKFFENNFDGFKLAEYDLFRRGPGEVYGIEQSGQVDLKLANLGDRDIIKKAREWAIKIVDNPSFLKKVSINFSFDKKVHWE